MEMKTTENQHKIFRHSRLFIAAAVSLVIVLLCAAGVSAAITLSSDKIYANIYIDAVNVGKMNREDALFALESHYLVDTQKELELTCGEFKNTVSVSALTPVIEFDAAVDEAYRYGREGSVFARLRSIHNVRRTGLTIPLSVQLNQEVLTEAVLPIAQKADQPEEDNQFEISGSELIVTRGHSGLRILPEHAYESVAQRILKNDYSPLELTLETVNPTEITADYIEKEVCGDPVDATYRVENRRLVIIDEKIGVSMDKAAADRIIRESSANASIRIPITTQQPNLTAEQLRASLFTDRLGSYSTRFNAGDTNRSYNIALACKNINETVLAPGDVFSYNEVVGPRTAARGFRTAHVYVGNKVEDGIGGGICQVSSTLYNAVVLSDLKIVTRTNHSLPVSYVPMGRDATVSDGSIDFKFENNTSSPIKIVAAASGGQTTVSVYGTQEHPGRTISIETERTATYPAKLEQKNDPELPEGVIKVEQKGSDGSSYNSYKITMQDGAVVSREFLAKSTYVAANRIELVGTKPPEASPSPADSPSPEAESQESTAQPDEQPAVKPVHPAA